MTRIATFVLTCLVLALVPVAAADAASRPSLHTQGTTIGIVVTGGNRRTAYVFDLDHRGTHKSACTGACLRAWKPVTFLGTARTHVRAPGITAPVRSIPAGGHRRQVTLGGWPLYYYVGDSAPGQVNGRGSGGVWWPVSPDGSRVKVIPVDLPPGTTGTVTGASYTLTTRSTSLGVIVVTGSGMTVYEFANDTPGNATSACTAACASVWYPVTAGSPPTATGDVTASVGTASDAQVELNGLRLYTFSGDHARGDVNGEAVAGWSAVYPSGTKVKG